MNRIIGIILALILSLPVFVWAEDDIAVVETPAIENNLEEYRNEPREDASPYKKPFSKRRLAKKFLAAMGAVGASSLALFLGLSIYNKLREGGIVQKDKQADVSSLVTPENLSEAVKSFLDKTDWS